MALGESLTVLVGVGPAELEDRPAAPQRGRAATSAGGQLIEQGAAAGVLVLPPHRC